MLLQEADLASRCKVLLVKGGAGPQQAATSLQLLHLVVEHMAASMRLSPGLKNFARVLAA